MKKFYEIQQYDTASIYVNLDEVVAFSADSVNDTVQIRLSNGDTVSAQLRSFIAAMSNVEYGIMSIQRPEVAQNEEEVA